jgi:hypothetical protein
MNGYKFIIKKPMISEEVDGYEIRVAAFPMQEIIYYRILSKHLTEDTDAQIRNAISEIKFKMMQEIMAAEFEYEK